MKKFLIILGLIFWNCTISAQKMHTVDGVTYELNTEVNGTINLHWKIIDGTYRYFIEKDGVMTELINTKNDDNKFQQEYKETLKEYTDMTLDTDKVKLTLYSLSNFIDEYNASKDPNYTSQSNKAKVGTRLLLFGGLSNSPFVENNDNKSNPVIGTELEIFEASDTPRHSVLLQVRHVFGTDDFDYSTTQFGLGYRFRFVNSRAVAIYANVMAATYNISKSTSTYLDVDDNEVTEERSGSTFDVPFVFGVGADIRLSNSSFITVTYNELFALFLENQGNFSTHLSLGFKFNL